MHSSITTNLFLLSSQFVATKFKAGVNVKAALTSLNTAFLPISRSQFQATLNLSAYSNNHLREVEAS